MRLRASLILLAAAGMAACTPKPEQSEQRELTYIIEPLDADWNSIASFAATHQATPRGYVSERPAHKAALESIEAFCGAAGAIASDAIGLEIVGTEESSGPEFFSSTPIFAFHCPKTGEEKV